MPKKTTHVSLVLDQSGSMGPTKDQTIAGFNDQLNTLREMDSPDNEILVTLTVFNTTVNVRYAGRPISEVSDLTPETYQPGGWTALYDAVGTTIINLEDFAGIAEDDAVLVSVFSDGDDRGPEGKNRGSKEYTSQTLANVINRLQETGQWTFTYLGCNQNLSAVAESLSIPVGNLCSYSQVRTSSGFEAQKRRTKDYFAARIQGACASRGFYSEDGLVADADVIAAN